MRKSSKYEMYLREIDYCCRMKKEDLPKDILKAFWYVGFYLEYLRFLKGSSLQTIEKLWPLFNKISSDYPDFNDLPPELRPVYKQTYEVLRELFRIFSADKDPDYVECKQITKAGGKKINELSAQLPSIYEIQPPDKNPVDNPE
jgi:hypothetical protein